MAQFNEPPAPMDRLEIEAVFSKVVQVFAWCNLQDDSVQRQGGL